MEKEFVPYTEALELKQLGFDEICIGAYFPPSISKMKYPQYFYSNTGLMMGEDSCTAPLYQQAFRWFRDVHNLKGGIEYIGGLTPETTWWDIYVVGHFNTNYKEMSMNYQPYEEAELACLKKLIEIVKTK